MTLQFLTRRIPFDRNAGAATLFCVVYAGTGALFSLLLRGQWIGLGASIVATAIMMLLYDRRFLSLGLGAPPLRAAAEFLTGLFWAGALALGVDTLITLSGSLNRSFTGLFSARELLLLFLPAALHEELVFRGYPFQKLMLSSRAFAVIFGSAVFAITHLGNPSVTTVGAVNVFLAGLVLSLAFLWRSSLWIPIGMHLGWNLATGPLLGHEVSGYITRNRVFALEDRGPELITGGDFGIEGSLWTTVVFLAAIVVLLRVQNRRKRMAVET